MQQFTNKSLKEDAVTRLGRPIWNNIYPVRSRYIDSLSDASIKAFGLPYSGDAELDEENRNKLIDCMITIDYMVELYNKGINIIFKDNNDTAKIYNIVNNYLIAWSDKLHNSLNANDAPSEDLIMLDQFCKDLLPQVHQFAKLDDRPNAIASLLNPGGGFNRDNIFKPKVSPTAPIVTPKQHESQAKAFTMNLSNGGSVWK